MKKFNDQSKIAHNQPDWVCTDCGKKYGRGPVFVVSCYHMGKCGVCNRETMVTESRDFGYLLEGWNGGTEQ